jgi:hypothetical protein
LSIVDLVKNWFIIQFDRRGLAEVLVFIAIPASAAVVLADALAVTVTIFANRSSKLINKIVVLAAAVCAARS